MPVTALLLAILLAFRVAPVVIETPDPRIAERLAEAQSRLGDDAVCRDAPSCDILSLNALALSSLGRLTEARAALQGAPVRTPLWTFTNYAYWTASADLPYLRAQWPFLATALFAPPLEPIFRDGGIELAAADAVLAMARVIEDSATVERIASIYNGADQRAQQRGGVLSVALGMINADRADSLVTLLADTVHRRFPLATGLLAWALYEQHREGEGYALLQQMIEQVEPTDALFVLPVIRGLFGWETDAPHRAISIEPHMPARWNAMAARGLVVGRDTVAVELQRTANSYTMHLRRQRAAPALMVQVSPALPRNARVRHVKVDDVDAPIQIDVTRHDTHVIVEVELAREATVEIEFDAPRRSLR